jgi:TolB-like protein/Tfp pilus assembly protein PilF
VQGLLSFEAAAFRTAGEATLTEPDVSKEEIPDKPASDGGLGGRLRGRLRLVGGAIASIAAVGAVVSGLAGYWNVWKTIRTEVFYDGPATQREAAARPDLAPRLSLVVLPFANLNNDPEQDYFADGIATDLTTDLAQMPGAFVIGRGTAFTYKNKEVDLKTLGKDLRVRWAVQAAVRRAGDQIRVNVSLADVSTGRDVWSDRFDGERTNLAALQDQITARLARSLNIQLVQAESRRSQLDRPTNPDAVDFSMRGWAKLYEPPTKLTNAQAKDLFDSALRLDPDNVDAMIGKASCINSAVILGWSVSVVEDKKIGTELIDQVLAKHSGSALAHVIKGYFLQYKNPEGALSEYDAALEIDPNLPLAYAAKGVALTWAGRAREAFSPFQIALRLSPKDPYASVWHYGLCHAHVHLHEYDEAVEECRRAINLNKAYLYPYMDLISLYGATGQVEQARQTLAELNAIRPDFTLQWIRQLGYSFSSNPQFRREFDDIVDGLRKAGVREQ